MISKVIKIKRLVFLLLISSFLAFMVNSCATDKLPEPVSTVDCNNIAATYDGLIKPIIDNNCALSGCHVSGGGGPGIYTSYNGLSNYLNKTGFEKFVIDLKNDANLGMPPNYSSGPKDLTTKELDIFKCWVKAGYPEN